MRDEAQGYPERRFGGGDPGPFAQGCGPGSAAEPARSRAEVPEPHRLRLRRLFLGGLRHRPGLRPQAPGAGFDPGEAPLPLPHGLGEHLQPDELRHRVQRRRERSFLRREDGERGPGHPRRRHAPQTLLRRRQGGGEGGGPGDHHHRHPRHPGELRGLQPRPERRGKDRRAVPGLRRRGLPWGRGPVLQPGEAEGQERPLRSFRPAGLRGGAHP